jgi:hypothetical protein
MKIVFYPDVIRYLSITCFCYLDFQKKWVSKDLRH